jgi:anti-sigma-K factor RskA
MSRSILSEELQLLIAGYVLGDLDPTEVDEFEQLLTTNPRVAEEVAQMQRALELSYGPPEIPPPAHLRSAILGAIEPQPVAQAEPRSVSPVPPARPSRRSFSWGKAWGIAAAALIAALGINNYRLWQMLQATQTAVQPSDTLTYMLQGTEPNNPASATLVVNPGRLEAALTVNNLPPPPPGQTYALWTVLTPNAPFTADRKNAVLMTVLQPDAEGRVEETIAVPPFYRSSEFVSKVAVTLENATAPQAHTGTPILISGL